MTCSVPITDKDRRTQFRPPDFKLIILPTSGAMDIGTVNEF